MGTARDRDRVLGAALLVALATACATEPVKTYPGPERPAEEIARLEEAPGATVFAIEGQRARGDTWLLLPGPYELIVKMRILTQAPNMYYEVWSYCNVRLDAAAGKAYRPSVRTQKKGIRTSIEIGLADETDALIARAHSCRDSRPAID